MDIRCVLLERASPFRSKWLNCIVLIVEINVDATIDVENDFYKHYNCIKKQTKTVLIILVVEMGLNQGSHLLCG